jgi:hypothetical protein
MRKSVVLLAMLFILLLVLAGCKKYIYVCANGVETEKKEECPYNKLATVKQKDAEKFGTNYVNALVQAKGGKATLVSSFMTKGDFYVSFVIAPKNQTAFETTVSVDGVTAQVNCTQNCQYVQ